MRVLGIDFGLRRIGLAVSDESATLARPWKTVSAGTTPQASASAIATLVGELSRDADADLPDLAHIVVGLPTRLNGEETDQIHGLALGADDYAPLVSLRDRCSR
jgi:putative Holliday junction resolvase